MDQLRDAKSDSFRVISGLTRIAVGLEAIPFKWHNWSSYHIGCIHVDSLGWLQGVLDVERSLLCGLPQEVLFAGLVFRELFVGVEDLGGALLTIILHEISA